MVLLSTQNTRLNCLFVWFDSLRPINNLSAKQGQLEDFLGWISTKLGQMCLAQGPQHSDAGEALTRGLESSTLPLSHCAPVFKLMGKKTITILRS